MPAGAKKMARRRKMVIRGLEILAAAVLLLASARRVPSRVHGYRPWRPGRAPSNGGTYPNGMNGLGQAVGNADTTVSTSSGTVLADHAFLYTGSGALVDLGTFDNGLGQSIAAAINNSGMVVGHSDSSGPGNPTRAFVYTQGGGMKDLGTLGGTQAVAEDINNLGQIVGYAQLANGKYDGFIYSGSGPMVDLGSAYSPLLINDAGEVVGIGSIGGSNTTYGTFVSSGGTGTWSNIGSLGGPQTYPYGINGHGQIVGYATTSAGSQYNAFLYSGGTITDLGDGFGGDISYANGINSYGEIVGQASLPGDTVGHAFVEFPGEPMEDLNDLIRPMPGWVLGHAYTVNDQGQILVAAPIAPTGCAVILTPTPEPSSFLIGLAGGVMLALTRSWRRLQWRGSCFLHSIRNRLQLLGGSEDVSTSMDARCSGAALGNRGNAPR